MAGAFQLHFLSSEQLVLTPGAPRPQTCPAPPVLPLPAPAENGRPSYAAPRANMKGTYSPAQASSGSCLSVKSLQAD